MGAALRQQGANGFLLGGEVSFLRFWMDETAFLGGYVDYLHDFGSEGNRISLGPEVGWMYMGLDAGPMFELGGERTEAGARARVFGSVVFATLYVGELCRLTTAETRWTTEVGVLLKFPFPFVSCTSKGCHW